MKIPPPQQLTVSYSEFIKNLRPRFYNIHTMQTYTTMQNTTIVKSVNVQNQIIAPNTSMIDFSSIPKYSLNKTFFPTTGITPIIPKTFNWYSTIKAPLLCPVLNQYACGSCWAFSTTSCLSDQFVIQGLLATNPQANVTQLMSCWKDQLNNQCGGSTPAIALSFIENHGIRGSSSIEDTYSWCTQNEKCNGQSHTETSTDLLNQLIPTCSVGDTIHPQFFVRNIRASPLNTLSITKENISKSILRVKEFILSKGPVVGNYNVYDNFYSSNFLCGGKNPDNIYLDLVDYEINQRKDSIQSFQFLGGHSVVIVGWSEGTVKGELLGSTYEPNKWYTVPYWIVRNSWGTSWGIQGFFHMAMYPYNHYSQFDVTVEIQYPLYNEKTGETVQTTIPTGGILLFEVSLTPLMESYSSSEMQTVQGYSSMFSSNDGIVSFFIILSVLLLLCFIICFFLFQSVPVLERKKG